MGTRKSRAAPAADSFKIVAMAASAGGLAALSAILSGLPGDFPASIAVVQHLHPKFRSHMAEILAQRTPLKVKSAENGERLAISTVYVAPPDKHLLIDADGTLSLTQTQLVHFLRPSADLLFESAAASCKSRVIGVVLSGTGTDGALGVTAIKKMGGIVIAQDSQTCEFAGMPDAARKTGQVDAVLPLGDIAGYLCEIVGIAK